MVFLFRWRPNQSKIGDQSFFRCSFRLARKFNQSGLSKSKERLAKRNATISFTPYWSQPIAITHKFKFSREFSGVLHKFPLISLYACQSNYSRFKGPNWKPFIIWNILRYFPKSSKALTKNVMFIIFTKLVWDLCKMEYFNCVGLVVINENRKP